MGTKKSNDFDPLSETDREYLTGFHLKNKYHNFALNTFLRLNTVNPVVDEYLTRRGKTSYAYMTASNPTGDILYPFENDLRNKKLKSDLADYEILDGEWNGDEYKCPPFASFFIPGISEEQAMKLALKYRQMTFVYGEKGKPAKLVFRPLNHIYRDILLIEYWNRSHGVTPEYSKHIKNLGSSPVISVYVPVRDPHQNSNKTELNNPT